MQKHLYLLLTGLLGSLSMWAQLPCADYGRDGVTVARFSHQTDIRDLEIDRTGAWVMAGSYEDGNGKRLAIMRFMPDGLPDYRFGPGAEGGVTPVFAQLSTHAMAFDIGISSGNQYFAGGGSASVGGFMSTNSNGNSFFFGGSSGAFFHIPNALGPVGSLVDANTFYTGYAVTDSRFELKSRSVQGDTVTVFGNNGSVEYETGATLTRRQPPMIRNQLDRKLLVGVLEAANASGNQRIFLYRFNEDGTVDNSFAGGNGVALTETGPLELNEITQQPDGKLLVVASSIMEGSQPDANFALAYRLNPDGSLDQTYGNNGRAFYGNDVAAGGAYLDAENRLWMAGFRDGADGNELLIAAWDSTGSPDASVGERAYWPLLATGTVGRLYGLRQMPDNSWLAWGTIMVDEEQRRGVLLRLNPDGTPMRSFGRLGYAYVEVMQRAGISKLVPAPQDLLYGFGGISMSGARGGDSWPAIALFEGDGRPDTLFGKRGVAVYDMGETGTSFNSGALQVNPSTGVDLRLFAAGTYDRANGMLAARFRLDGTPDSTFGEDGFVTHRAICFNCLTSCTDAIPLSNGYLLAGSASAGSGNRYTDAVLMRLNVNGDKDLSFGDNGELRLDQSIYDETFTAVDIFPNGNLVAAGYYETFDEGFTRKQFVIRARSSTGQFRTSFGIQGIKELNMRGLGDRLVDIAVQSRDKVVLAFYMLDDADNDSSRVGMLRLDRDGEIDRSFGDTGYVYFEVPGAMRYSTEGLVLLPGDSLLLTGYMRHPSGFGNVTFLAKYTSRGRLVSNFGDNGIMILEGTPIQPSGIPVYLPDEDRVLLPGSVGNYYGGAVHCIDLNANAAALEDEVAEETEPLHVYPNPAQDRLTATWVEPLPQGGTLSLLDMQGRLLQQETLPPGSQAWQGQVANYPPGLYLLRVQAGQEVWVKRWQR
mgnify:CR=1 FL=1